MDWWEERKKRHQEATPKEVAEYQNMRLDDIGDINEDAASISARIRQILLTSPGEVPQKLRFGSFLSSFIDNPQGTTRVKQEVKRSLGKWIPEIFIEEIEVEKEGGVNRLYLQWRLLNYKDVFNVVVDMGE